MQKNSSTGKILLGLVLSLPLVAFAAGDAAAGKAKSGTCAGCHGPNGKSANDLWPNLAGQKAGYLAKQMKDFRDGKRTDPMMSSMSKGLTDQDIANLAAYYAAEK